MTEHEQLAIKILRAYYSELGKPMRLSDEEDYLWFADEIKLIAPILTQAHKEWKAEQDAEVKKLLGKYKDLIEFSQKEGSKSVENEYLYKGCVKGLLAFSSLQDTEEGTHV